MNCKPGDLACVVRALCSRDEWSIGFLVRVVSLSGSNFYGNPCWRIESPIKGPNGFTCIGLPDECLRPIRPGESPEESTEAMKRLHETTVPAKKKEPVVRPFQWEEL